jgi:hypothetical protein
MVNAGINDVYEAADSVARTTDAAWPEIMAARDWLASKVENVGASGRMYEVNIAGQPEDFIDYDKPLSEQSDLVKKYFGYVPKPTAEEERAAIDAMLGIGDPASRPVDIEDMYRRESAANEAERRFQRQVQGGGIDEAARIALSEAGVPGVRYLDAGSRRDGDGSRNYVVFDDRLISIVRMYGIAGAAALLGVSVADVEQAMAEGMAAEGMDKAEGGVVRSDGDGVTNSEPKEYAVGGMVSQYDPAMIDQIVNRVRGAGRG